MCGLAGWHRSRNLPDVGLSADVMAGALVHRGPTPGIRGRATMEPRRWDSDAWQSVISTCEPTSQ